MKLLYTLTTASLFGLTALASAECNTCEKDGKTCNKEVCEKESDCGTCDKASANTVHYAVTGMTCEACSGKLKKALAAVEGCTVGKVCHKTGCVDVTIDPAKTDKSKVQAAINATGFNVAGEKLSIPVSGMTCGACSKKLTTALTAIDGCTVGKVCHKSGHAAVTIDTSKTTQKAVEEAINKTGFKTTTTKAKEMKKASTPEAKKG